MHFLKQSKHPVIIGVGQITHREKITGEYPTVIDLAKQAIDLCVLDTEKPDILRSVDSLSVVNMFSEYSESPVNRLCEKIGITPARREETAVGGNNPQWLVNRAADKILSGEFKIALLVGAEALYRNSGDRPIVNWLKMYERLGQDPTIFGDIRRGTTPHEMLHGVNIARHFYPFFENALRAHLKMSLQEHREFMKGYFKKMEEAAAGNPYAWFGKGKKWDDVTEPSPDNPMFNFPYTKYMNPVMYVNQAAALMITDTETAKKIAIPKDKWIYLHGGSEAADKWYISERANYYSSPVVRFTTEAALQSAGLELNDIDFFDLYSCFPCATIIAAMEIGLPVDHLPPLSITGGLSFFGGPGNNYTMHSIAHAVERLRKHREQYGFITGIGHYMTKHTVGIYSGIEPQKAWNREPNNLIKNKIAALDAPALNEKPQGPVTIETYTVLHDKPDGIPWPVIIARLDSGERCFATTEKGSDLAMRMEQEEFIGQRGFVKSGKAEEPNIFSI